MNRDIAAIRPRSRVLGLAMLAIAVLVAPLRAAGQAESPKPQGGMWLSGDLHIHTCFSHDAYCGPDDDNTGPEEAYTLGRTVEEQFCDASRRDLDFLAITDHNDVRSQKDPGWGACGVLPIHGYENSLQGHAQMLGAQEVYEKDGSTAAGVNDLAARLRADGGTFQINHPAGESVDWPNDPDWKYGYDVIPDTVETWNISTLWQPPAPSGSSNDDAIRYWEGWLDRGYHVGATGGSDNHYKSTSPVQGPGQPTTWVYAADRSEEAILEGLRTGRTTISHEPPGYGGSRVFLEADSDGDGTFESIVGDTVPAGSAMRARVENAPGAEIHVLTTAGEAFAPVPVVGAAFERRFAAPMGATWVRAEVVGNDRQAERKTACDEQLGDQTTYCRSRLLRLAMTSAIYVEDETQQGDAYGIVDGNSVTLGNSVVERKWTAAPFGTQQVVDKRTGLQAGASPDFRLSLAGDVELTGEDFTLSRATATEPEGGGVSVSMELSGPGGIGVTRTVSVYPGIAGFQVSTAVTGEGLLARYVLDELQLPGLAPQIHSFRAGYDWRGSDSLDWAPQASPFGGHHSGDHRVTTEAGPGQDLSGEAEWMSLRAAEGPRAFMVLERVDYSSSRMEYTAGSARAAVDLDHDLAYLGPFESDIHVGNPGTPARYRVLRPDRPLDLEPVFTGFALDADDEPWQHYKYLDGARPADWSRDVVFNSNGVDGNRISTGAKDDMDLAEVQRQAEVAKRLGVETFVLDDGWQAASGDWCPDSPECPEPRGLYPPRFPDARFEAVREVIAPMKLGLWMSPMQFNPAADAYQRNPQWNCHPVGDALVAYNTADPDSSSNEAGLGTWNPEATGPEGKLIDYIEGRIRRAIVEWQVRYFKFDFMAWTDCAGVDTVTAYEYRESFIRMLDRLIEDYPQVTFQIDETNDYRLFPFESVYRGPSWYANGHPKSNEGLHNLWVLAPYVPGYTLGQAAMGQRDSLSSDYLMAVALASHMTFFTDLTRFTGEQVAAVERWTTIYKEHRDRFATFSYPLLDDPLPGNSWTGLQPWNPDTGKGALLVFRQDSADETRTVPLRGIRGDGSYRLSDAETGETFGVFSAGELREGISISLPSKLSARVFLIDPA
ncbi:MAG: CehA/McbA family metallohydrolase [Actinomycetota bacterium]